MYYEKQATDFMKETETTMKTTYIEHEKHFPDDKDRRDIWRITLRRHGKSYSFKYGQSLADVGETPTAYSVLACLTIYDPGTFENFCGDYGYVEDSRKAEKTYKAVVKEFAGVNRLFADVIDELAEIA